MGMLFNEFIFMLLIDI